MTSEVILQTRVQVHPQDLDKDIRSELLESLRKRKQDFSSLEKGAVIDILSVESYVNFVEMSGMVIFSTTFLALVFSPSRGDIVEATVERVLSCGVVCCCHGVRIWLHGEGLPDYEWNGTCLTGEKGTLNEGRIVKVRISTIRYEKKTFSCIGSLIDN